MPQGMDIGQAPGTSKKDAVRIASDRGRRRRRRLLTNGKPCPAAITEGMLACRRAWTLDRLPERARRTQSALRVTGGGGADAGF